MNRKTFADYLFVMTLILAATIYGFAIGQSYWQPRYYYYSPPEESNSHPDSPIHHPHVGTASMTFIWAHLRFDLHSFLITDKIIALNFTTNLSITVTITENATFILNHKFNAGNHYLWHQRNTTAPIISLIYKWSWMTNKGYWHWLKDHHLYWNDD